MKTANKIDLGENTPYFFKGEKARVQRRGREDALTYLKYSGTGYLFKYKGIEFILIPLYPIYSRLNSNALSVLKEKDRGEVRLSLNKNLLRIRIYYIKDSSGSIRLEILDKIVVKYGLGGIRLFSMEKQGNREHQETANSTRTSCINNTK